MDSSNTFRRGRPSRRASAAPAVDMSKGIGDQYNIKCGSNEQENRENIFKLHSAGVQRCLSECFARANTCLRDCIGRCFTGSPLDLKSSYFVVALDP